MLERPVIAQGGAVHFVGVGPNVEEATEDAARRAGFLDSLMHPEHDRVGRILEEPDP